MIQSLIALDSPSKLEKKGIVLYGGKPSMMFLFNTVVVITRESRLRGDTIYKLKHKEAIEALQRFEPVNGTPGTLGGWLVDASVLVDSKARSLVVFVVPENDEKRREEEGRYPFWIVTAKRKHLVGVDTIKEREGWISALLGAVSALADREVQSRRARGA